MVGDRLERAAAVSWRVLVVAALAVAVCVLLGRLLIVVVPVGVALLICRVLAWPSGWMQQRGVGRGVASGLSIGAFVLVASALVAGVGASVAAEFDQLGSTIDDGISDVEDWLVDDSPFDVDRDRLAEIRDQIGDRAREAVSSSDGALSASAIVAAEIVAGSLLALVVAFFFLKDRESIVAAGLRAVSEPKRPRVGAVLARAWSTLGAYLRGVALLGVVEAVIIGFTVWVVGGRLVAAVVVVTVLGAFVPIVGAVVAGVVAVLVTLATAGIVPALIVAGVALVVQQLDNDLLAPVIYGRSMKLHPLVILLSVAGGAALFGFIGAVAAVPVVAVTLNMFDELRNHEDAGDDAVVDTAIDEHGRVAAGLPHGG